MTIKKNNGIEVVKMGNELAMMNLNTGKYLVINEMGNEIWGLIDKEIQISEIVKALMDIYDVTEETCTNEVNTFINQLVDEEIVSRI